MDLAGNIGLDGQLRAALDWWRDAGVDCDFHDEPACWTAQPDANGGAASENPAIAALPKIVKKPSARDRADDEAAAPVDLFPQLPATLAEFGAWWMTEPALDGGRVSGRVPPRGMAGAEVMVLVPEPEREDAETLLSGPEGRLLAGILAAMGIRPESAYVASALPRHTPHPDWAAIAATGMGKVIRHHISLVAPRQVISFGHHIPSLIDNALPNSPAFLPSFNHGDISFSWIFDRTLGSMLERPRWKAGFWKRWLDGAARD